MLKALLTDALCMGAVVACGWALAAGLSSLSGLAGLADAQLDEAHASGMAAAAQLCRGRD